MRQRIQRMLTAAVGLLLLLSASGCGFSFSPTDLYSLPQLPEEYTELNSSLNQLLESGAEYAAPVSGSNIQPVQLEDLDGDGEEEALAFFRNSADEKPLKIYIFTAGKQGYEQAAVIEGTGTSIYSIAYEDLDQDGRKELLVGWRVNTDLLALSVYTLRSGEPEELVQGTSYVKYAVNDLNQDGLWELVVLRADEEGNGIADYYCWQEEEFQLRTSARITSTMAELNQGSVVTGKLDQDTPAVFITGINSQGIAVTDILVWQEDAGLVNAALDRSTGLSTATVPYRQLTPQDINGDGITELPRPDSSVSDTKQADGMVFWEQYRPDGLATVERTYHCLSGGWYFILPEDWTGDVTALASDAGIGETQVTLSVQGEKALSICALTGENRERRALRGNRVVLRRRTGTIYAAETLSEIYSLDEEALRHNFNLIVHSWDAN